MNQLLGTSQENQVYEPAMANHNFVFIAGLHRSGTSLLFQCLRDHPQISGFRDTGVPEDEGQHLQSVYKPASRLGGPGRFGFALESHRTENSALAAAENRGRLFSQWCPHWDLSKTWLLEKTPQNLLQTRLLQCLFPSARFIVMQRHPVAVSYATRRWSRTSLHSLFEHWLRCHEIFDDDRSHLDHVLVVRYEDFVAKPTAILEEVYGFLDVDPIAQAMQVRNANEKYFRIWQQNRGGTFSRFYVRELVRQFEARTNQFGYSLSEANPLLGIENSAHPGPVDVPLSSHFATVPMAAAYRSAAYGRYVCFCGYKQLKRAVRRIYGSQRNRRPAVTNGQGMLPQSAGQTKIHLRT